MSPIDRLNALKNWEKGPRARMAPTLAPMQDLMRRLDNPHRTFSVVHVTGSKGKGSVCALVESALHRAGVRVGRYASPHVFSMCERISVRCKQVQESRLEAMLARVLDVRDESTLASAAAKDATWFDVLTAAAFVLLAEEKLEWVVAEVGLGGRLDSTNVVDGKVCVITNVALEHTDVLGSTLPQIAREKGGIIKRHSIVVSGADAGSDAHVELAAIARERDASLIMVPRQSGVTQQNLEVARTVLDCLSALGVKTSPGSRPIARGDLDVYAIRCAALPGRLERMEVRSPGRPVTVLLDGAHVDIALDAVLQEVRAEPWAAGPLTVLFALGRDKNPRSMLAALADRAEHLVFIELEDHECWSPEELAPHAAEFGMSCSIAHSTEDGLRRCFNRVRYAGWVLATGSLHLVAPVRRALAATQQQIS